jgi:hypothetical protein
MLRQSYHSAKYDYQSESSCDTSGCYDEGICRCTRIVDQWITHVDMQQLTDEIYDQFLPEGQTSIKRQQRISELLYGGEIVDKYCINRILTINKVFEPRFWEVLTTGGYYGDEIDQVNLDDFVLHKIELECEQLFNLSTLADKLRLVLQLEYGHILDDLKTADFELCRIYKSDIDFKKLNQNHISNVKMEDLTHYAKNTYHLPRGIVRGSQDNYKIVDGFHRIIAAPDKSSFEVFRIKN